MRDRRSQLVGYLTSGLIFVGITALWAWIVRDDPYYAMTQLLGLRLPVLTVAYITVMPLIGFAVGRWRFESRRAGGVGGLAATIFARLFDFLYSHLLISLFTVAMAVRYFFDLEIAPIIAQLDEGLFAFAARFAPWISAYLAGFNLGRAWTGLALITQPDKAPA